MPCAREASGFTLLFEAFIMAMAKEMPVNAIARIAGEHDTRIGRILYQHVEEARSEQDYPRLRCLIHDVCSPVGLQPMMTCPPRGDHETPKRIVSID